jgi:putative transcriptional regulator
MSHVGRLLVATPLIGDPHFERSVVLLLAHGDEGAFGLVLNRPSDTAVREVLPDWADHVTPPAQLFLGGPVGPDAVVGIGRPGARPDGGDGGAGGDDPDHDPDGDRHGFSPLVGGIGSVDLGRPPEGGTAPWAELRLFAGSAGWAVGQLEDELREGAWWPVPAEPGDVFSPDPAGLWRRVLRRQPGPTGWFANCPLDPSAN